jgi:hypothetical protein
MKFLNLRKNFSKIFFVLTLFSFIGFASASIPQLIAFQGKLTDKNGALINGNTAITFNIYTTSTGGTSLYNETQTINVQNGLVSALIGSNNPLTLPFNQQYYLGITVASDSEMTPRLALTAAPYAFNSINAVNSINASYAVNANNSAYSVNATNANNSGFLGGVAAGSYALFNGNYQSMTVGSATNANNSGFLGGVAASNYFQNGGALTASSASIGGHTPWTAASCTWMKSSTQPVPSGNSASITITCNSGYYPISAGYDVGSPAYATGSYVAIGIGPNVWEVDFWNPGSGSSTPDATVWALCCPN